ncbi:unnamed protein product [Tuber aestivum]|uniref:Uncharacterized protein n=1 Tax=Tuber aestivum TaxID=59557 RepID=A0A292Q0Z6_9PEZI|nr:unnamed protein product [Tuber aestivum]
MARTRSISNDRVVGHRARDPMHRNRYSHSPIGSSQRTETELQAVVRTRAKSASPGPALIAARRTLRKSNGTTPVLPSPSPSGLAKKNRVAKQRAGPRSQRGRSRDGDDVFGPSREESMAPVQAHGAQEGDKIPRVAKRPFSLLDATLSISMHLHFMTPTSHIWRSGTAGMGSCLTVAHNSDSLLTIISALPDLPEDEVISFASSLDTPRSSVTSGRSGSLSDGPITSRAIGAEKSSTQRELEAMDTELVLESTSELDRNAQRLLDLLILNPPEEDMLASTHTRSSKVSKRLRVYWPAFDASKIVFGTSHFLDVGTVEAALGEGIYTPVIYRANLAILANFIYTADEEDDSTFQELKSIERCFPAQVGGVIDDQNLQFALDLRTQTVIRGMLSVREDSLEPDVFLRHFFMEKAPAKEANDGKPEYRCKSWPGSRDVDGWEKAIVERTRSIRSTFCSEGGQDDDGESQGGRIQVNFEKLVALFPWKEFVCRIADFIKGRLGGLENSNAGAGEERGPGASKGAVDEEAVQSDADPKSQQHVEASPKNGGTFNRDTSQISTEVDEVEYLELPNFGNQTVDNQNPDSQPEASSQFVGGGSQLNVRAVKLIKRDLLAKEALSKDVLANPMSSIVSNPESIATTVAQVNAIKKRKRKSEIMEIANRHEDEEAYDTTLGYAVSETVVNNLAQMKQLKGAKKRLVQQRQSDPTPLPLPSGRQEPSGGPDNLPSTNRGDGGEFTRVSEDDWDESDGDSSDDPGYRAFSQLRREQDKENKKRMTPMPLPSPRHRKRLKRFTDPQEGAKRTSPIDEEGAIIYTPPIRSDKSRSKRRGRILVEGEKEQEEDDEQGAHWEQGVNEDEDGSEFVPDPRDDEDEDEDDSEFVPDPRQVRDDVLNRSRRDLPSSSEHGSMPSSDSTNSSRRGAVVLYNHSSAGDSPTRRRNGSRVALASANPSQRSPSEEANGRRAGSLGRRFDEGGHRSLQEVARINRLAKINRAAVHTLRRPTTFWTERGTKALIQAIHDHGPSWAVIRDVRVPLILILLLLNAELILSHQSAISGLEGRDNVQLKDKARNIKVDMIKAKIALPECFRRVSIKKTDMEILAKMGIYPDENGNYLEDHDRCSGHTFEV